MMRYKWVEKSKIWGNMLKGHEGGMTNAEEFWETYLKHSPGGTP